MIDNSYLHFLNLTLIFYNKKSECIKTKNNNFNFYIFYNKIKNLFVVKFIFSITYNNNPDYFFFSSNINTAVGKSIFSSKVNLSS